MLFSFVDPKKKLYFRFARSKVVFGRRGRGVSGEVSDPVFRYTNFFQHTKQYIIKLPALAGSDFRYTTIPKWTLKIGCIIVFCKKKHCNKKRLVFFHFRSCKMKELQIRWGGQSEARQIWLASAVLESNFLSFV